MLSFKRIEMLGFKSFADKTIIEFNGGITGIVGPNGCGKSNVADAVRWVLGEQSSKLLRGSSMQDVIFAGTEKRKSLSYCEVSLVLDNSLRTLDIDYDEVAIARKLYRSGESEYLINKNPCRLKDIIEILHDSGMGRDGYSIIGQGKVQEIIMSKPEARRTIFEEAAGIAKFKAKKQDAERRLSRVRDDLDKIQIKIDEIELKMEPLKLQAEDARKFLNYKEQLKKLEINNYIYNYDNASEKKEKHNQKINALSEEIVETSTELEKVILEYNQNFESIKTIDISINELYRKMVDLKVNLEKKSGETNVLKERLNALKEEESRIINEVSRLNLNIENSKNEITNKETEKNLTKINAENLAKEAEKIREQYLTVVDELEKNELDAESSQNQMLTSLESLGDIKAEISAKGIELDVLNNKSIELNNNFEQTSSQYEKTKKNITNLTTQINLLKDKREVNKINISKAMSLYNETIIKLRSAEKDEQDFISSAASVNARKKMLEDMQKDFDGFNNTIKRILEAKQNRFKNEVLGVVANLIKVDEKYQTAVEMALGNAVQNIVVENEQDASKVVDYLKKNNYGRATFLPISSLKPRRINDNERAMLRQDGVYGVASELIEYDYKYSNIFEGLLGATVIVDDLNTAISLAKQSRYTFKIVTLDGDVINPQGSISGGSKKSNISNLIGRERELEDIKKLFVKIDAQLSETVKQKNILQKSFEEIQQQIKQLNYEQQESDLTEKALQEKINNENVFANNYNALIEKLKADIQSNETKIAQTDLILNELKIKAGSESSIRENVDKNITRRQQQFDHLKQERDAFNEKITANKIEQVSLNSKIIGLEQEILRLNEQIKDDNLSLENLNEKDVKIKTLIKNAELLIGNVKQTDGYVEAEKQLIEVNEKLSKLDEFKADLQQKIKDLDEKRLKLNTVVSKLNEKKYNEEMNLNKVDSDIEFMQERIWEEYELTYLNCLEFKQDDYNITKGMQETNKLKREIDKLGYVNVNAIEESRLTEERYSELTIQTDDLKKAEADCTKIIKEMSTEMATRFAHDFEIINNNFTVIFKELFGGGNAKLVLTEPESGDPLEAGVEIIAEPPGKKLQSITLLSGGESSLTAIAILFAILKLRPMPFCLLDEIEAALDDANVNRFAKYLKRFSNQTQFIVITHKKPTMEYADTLYGVTMEEKGVSKIVSVMLKDVEEGAVA